MQAIYQWQINHTLVPELIKQFVETNNMQKVDFDHFKELVTAAVDRTPMLDAMLKPLLDRELTELDPIELAILRLTSFEMKERVDIPYRVVINEGVELAKKYGATDGHKYVNGILDKLAKEFRQAEKS
jgi:N utilization substance protein B